MLRTQASRLASAASRSNGLLVAARSYATYNQPPPEYPNPGGKSPAKDLEPDNTLLYVGLGLGAAGGAYYFLRSSDEPAALEKKARKDEDRMKTHAAQTLDASRDRARDSVEIGKAKLDHAGNAVKDSFDSAKDSTKRTFGAARDSARETVDSAKGSFDSARDRAREDFDYARNRARDDIESTRDTAGNIRAASRERARDDYDSASGTIRNATRHGGVEEGRGLFDRAEDKLDQASRATRDTLNHTKESTESLLRSTRDSSDRKSAELREDAKRGKEEVKEGWFSWLGYGEKKVDEVNSSAREAKERLDAEAERLKKEAASKVARTAEDVRIRADKHA